MSSRARFALEEVGRQAGLWDAEEIIRGEAEFAVIVDSESAYSRHRSLAFATYKDGLASFTAIRRERFPDAPEYIYDGRLIRILVLDLWWLNSQSRLSSDGLTAQWRASGHLDWTHHIDSDPYGCVERLHSTVDALRHPPTWYRNELHDMLDYDLDALIGLRSSVHRFPTSEGRRVRARLNCL